MKRQALLAAVAALLASPAWSTTVINHVNGLQVGADGKLQHFSALVIGNDGKIAQVIPVGMMVKLAGVDTVVDGQGKTLLPGLIDGHGHVLGLGFSALQLDLVGTSSLQDLQQRLKAYAAAHPDSRWIVGRGWNQELWPVKNFPTAADLDAMVPDRPVVLERVDGHAVVANTAAMKAAGVSASTQAPSGGRIENGLFVDNAIELVTKAIPDSTPAEYDQALAKAQDILLSYGVTGVGSMSTGLADWNAMKRAGEAGKLQVRLMVYADELKLLPQVPHPTGWLYGDRLRMVGIKFYADGALGSRGAALLEPYSDDPKNTGLLVSAPAHIEDVAERALASGFQVATHAIGDRGNRIVLDAYEKALQAHPTADHRFRIEHAQILNHDDIPRFAQLGVIPSMQAVHQTSDMYWAGSRLGIGRLLGAYAWRSLLNTGVVVPNGSDAPVEAVNPLFSFHSAVSREDAANWPTGGWMPEQRMTRAEALASMTIWPAYAAFQEQIMGSITPGKLADFVILDRDIMTVPEQDILGTSVLATYIGGKAVYERPAGK